MKTLEYTTIDREKLGWAPGPWDGEPDKVQWQDEETGLPCLAVRHPSSGHWCGYVGVAETHPLYQVDCSMGEHCFDVHGGITFGDMCSPGEDESKGVCHLPDEGEPDHVWWHGFDCHHSGDSSPGYDLHWDGTCYRPLSYIKSECKSLAQQLKSLET